MGRCCFSLILVLLSLTCVSGISRAQEPGSSADDVKERFNKGVELAGANRFDEAIALWLGVLQDIPPAEQPRVHKALGFGFKKTGHLPEAWYHISKYLSAPGVDDATVSGWLADVEAELKKTHVKATLNCSVAGATVGFEEVMVASGKEYPCPLTWWVLPGKHKVQVSASGFKTGKFAFTAGNAGAEQQISLTLSRPGPEKAPAKKESPKTLVKEAPSPGTSRTLEWAVMGGAGVALLAGAVFNLMAVSTNADLHKKFNNVGKYPSATEAKQGYDKAYDSDVQPKLTAAYVLYGVGAVAALSSGAMFLLRGGSSVPAAVESMPVRDGAGAVFVFCF